MENNTFICTEVDSSANVECISLSDSNGCRRLLNFDTNNEHSLIIVTVNIRSINRNFDSFVALMSSLDVQVDVYVLTECWTSSENTPPYLDGYKMFWTQNFINQNDGVVAYVKQEIEATSYEPECSDGNCLVINISPDYSVLCTYRPPSFKNETNYLHSIDEILKKITTRNIILTGDVNIDTLASSLPKSAQTYLNMIALHGLRQGITRPTRISTCLDHFMVKTSGAWKTIVFEQKLTDHSTILLYINNAKLRKATTNLKKIIINHEGLNESFLQEQWRDIYESENVNQATELLTSKLINIINKNTQIKITSKRNQPLKPWITIGVVKCIRKRDALHKKVKMAPEDPKRKEKYIKYRNQCNKIIKNLKIEYYKHKLNLNKGNIKETWKVIKEVCDFKQSKVPSKNLLKNHDNPTAALNVVNSYFTSIGGTLADNILNKMNKTEDNLAALAKESNPPVNSMSFTPTDPYEVKSVIFGLKSHSAPGWDKVTTDLLKKFVMFLAEPIAFICNLSFETGIFPSIFKQAVVCPVFKSGDKSNPSNYRPISLLSTLSKVLEKLVKKRVMRYLESNNLLNKNQYGFREGKSTEDAVLTLTSLITSYMDKRYKCVGIFLDLQKAFDTVSIRILLKRLENVGIRGLTLKWFKDYLSNRFQRVRVEESESDNAGCTFGVPQGSTLGPTLFLIYINELCTSSLPGLDLLMFADDTVLLCHEKSWPKVKQLAETCLSNVTRWLEDNLLTLNISKTKYLCFSKRVTGGPKFEFEIKIHTYPCNRSSLLTNNQCSCSHLTSANSIKYLGVLLDDKLTWQTHIHALASKIRKLIYVFKILRTVADQKLILQTYKSLCECIIRYCICVWGSADKTYLITAERAQRAVLKVMMYLPFRHPTTEVYDTANVLTVRKLFIHESIRRHHRKTPPTILIPSRRNKIYRAPLVNTRYAQKQYNVVVTRLYNELNKSCKVDQFTDRELKKTILMWLKAYDYKAIEDMLEGFYF